MRVERLDDVVVWTIDRPQSKNALDLATIAALTAAAGQVERSVRAVVLTGAGGAFVSGGDLRELRHRHSTADAEVLSDAGFAMTTALETLHCPVIAAIDGPAIGGGAELAVACDLRVASPSARIAFKQVRMGVTTAWGAAARLERLVGSGRAARLLLTGREVAAEEAHAMGLVEAIAPDARAKALEWAADIALGSPAAVTAMKELLGSPEARSHERELFCRTWSGAEHREAVEAYFERRAPKWNA